MQWSVKVLPAKANCPRASWWIFVLAWLIGNLALIAGFEGAQGLLEDVLALCVLLVACGAWWGAYKISNFRNRGGFIVIALWMCTLLVPLLDFRHYTTDPFFWGSAAMLAFLAGGAALTRPRTSGPDVIASGR